MGISQKISIGFHIMPYFIYRISAISAAQNKQLELRHTFDVFKEAKAKVRSMRGEQDPQDPATLKIIFADSPEEAEQRLTEMREKPILKEWEK
jgi:hypothetical protein